jgi:hypothetical protein
VTVLSKTYVIKTLLYEQKTIVTFNLKLPSLLIQFPITYLIIVKLDNSNTHLVKNSSYGEYLRELSKNIEYETTIIKPIRA